MDNYNLNEDIYRLNISGRLLNALRKNNFNTVNDIIEYSRNNSIRDLKYFGETTFIELKDFLINNYGIDIEQERYRELNDLGLSEDAIKLLTLNYNIYSLKKILDLSINRKCSFHRILNKKNNIAKEIIDKIHDLGFQFYDEKNEIQLTDSISNLDLPFGIIISLNRRGIESIEDLLNLSLDANDSNSIYKAHNIGPKKVQEIIDIVHSFGFKFTCENDIKEETPKEKFYNLRKELVGESCKEVKEKIQKYNDYIKKYPNDEKILLNPSIRQRVLKDLQNEGYNLEDIGTQYLATLATMYYHERNLFRMDNIEDNGYFDLSLKYNEHYSMLGNKPDIVRNSINEAIYNAYGEVVPIDEIVYFLADNYNISETSENNKKYYSKVLLK